MIFRSTLLEGAWLIQPERRCDRRGFFARTWCRDEYAAMNLDVDIAQQSISYNRRRGTLRGLHFQRPPHQETKIVRCSRGAIWDVILDLRPGSPSYLRSQAFELSVENQASLYIPKGMAHGYQTLTDDAEVSYQMSVPFSPHAAAGFRFDDPTFAIALPLSITEMSDRDREWPDFRDELADA
jgi:dTDP-4-dehydrorhamnose 3,5-epimerase